MYNFKFGVSETLTAFQNSATAGFKAMERATAAFGNATKALPRSIDQIEDKMRTLRTAQSSSLNPADVRRYGREIVQLENQISRLRGESVRTGSSLRGMVPSIGAMGLGFVANDAMKAAMEMDGLSRAITFASGGADQGKVAISQLQKIVADLGMPLKSSMEGFKTLRGSMMGSAMGGAEAIDIFKAMGEASTVLGIDAAGVTGSFLAMGQMVSKGKVSMEELRQQLGERMPGAFSMAAKAMNMTTGQLDKFISDGKLTADTLLPKFAQELHKTFGAQAQKDAQSSTANWNRMNNALLEAKVVFGQGVLPLFLTFSKDYLVPGLKWIKDHQEAIKKWTGVFWELGQRVFVVYVATRLVRGVMGFWAALDIKKIAGDIKDVASSMWGVFRSTLRAIGGIVVWGVQVSLWTGRAIVRMGQFIVTSILSGNLLSGMAGRFKWSAIVAGFTAMRGAVVRFLFTAIPGFVGWVAGLSLATVNTWLLNAAMYANPIGLVILGVAALTATFYGLFKLIDWLMPGAFDSIVGVFKSIWDWIKKYFIDPIIGFFKWLAGAFSIKMPSAGETIVPGTTEAEAELAKLTADFNMGAGGLGNDKGGKSKKEEGAVSGSNRPGIVNLNVQRMGDGIVINVMKLEQSEAQVREYLNRLLLTSLNDAQLSL